MLINSLIELAVISIISKDRQETSHSQWLALPQGWALQSVPCGTAVPEVWMHLPKWMQRTWLAAFQCLCPLKQGSKAGERGPCLSWLPSGGNIKVPNAWHFPRESRACRYLLLWRRRWLGAGACRRHWDCSAFEGCYLITLLHNDITCVFPLLIHLCRL